MEILKELRTKKGHVLILSGYRKFYEKYLNNLYKNSNAIFQFFTLKDLINNTAINPPKNPSPAEMRIIIAQARIKDS